MISNYEPIIIVTIFILSCIMNISMSTRAKFSIIFFIHSAIFMWFLFHFLYSVL
ncbi:hypothetical protein 14D047_00183 [Fowlpox virus]|uniref:A14.5L IMV membrane virulence protein n=1 Tax=Fowlpox virus TaxID=10261 RepID=Q70GY0_FOWPV|nr:A14.5L IMV membrane virulence protein [Fowlpox virus]UNS14408.1 ALPV-244 [Albatrosspox virus]WCB87069.1 CPPV258 A14.5L IMV membrane virulence protein [Cooks petrelpox virus]WPD90891.1 A14.5-like IMV membrane virulence protein [Avipoxvirus sp.]CAE52717.1 A14.5L IMV membrane virulence protein orthologue [Fowlpox virus isolate HP-438/Munich]